MNLWIGQSVSLLGSQVTLLALPLTAVLVLDASPAQLGLLYAAQTAPFIVFGLLAGVWVDRLPRRPLLVLGDLGRAVLLTCIPVSAMLRALTVEQMYVVAFLVGMCTLIFDVAYQSYLPAVVARRDLVQANARLELSRSTAQIVGPGVAGVLVQTITAPLAILADAVSFVASSALVWTIHAPESPQLHARQSLAREIGVGLRAVLGQPLLRRIAGCTATSNLFSSALTALLVLFATSELGLTPAAFGLIVGAGSVGALLAAVANRAIVRRLGTGPTIVGGISVTALGAVLIPLSDGPLPVASVVLACGQALMGFGGVLYNVNQVSLRQTLTPDAVLGRMNATMRFLVWGTMPIGGLLGGVLAEHIGLRATLAVAAVGSLLAPVWVAASPLVRLRSLDAAAA